MNPSCLESRPRQTVQAQIRLLGNQLYFSFFILAFRLLEKKNLTNSAGPDQTASEEV